MQRESPTLERARARWERLSPEDQARFRDRYERYRNLSEEERVALKARAERMHEAKERFRSEMAPELRAKLDKLPARERDRVLNELAVNAARERGARIREKLPESWLERLERARPEDRGRFLSDMQQQGREKSTREAIDRIGQKLGLPAAEVERLKALPGPDRTRAMLELGKTLSVKDVAQFGLPPGLTEEQWKKWSALPPHEFFEALQRHRSEHGWRGFDRGRDGRTNAQKGPPSAFRRVMDAQRPRPEEVVQYAGLPEEERRQRLYEARRERVLAVLREERLADERRLGELSRMNENELRTALRDVFPRNDWHGGRNGQPRDERRGPPQRDF
jgi:hypothetical protein